MSVMGGKVVTVLIARYDTEITEREIPFLRGAVIQAAGRDNVLLHNHVDEQLRYSYPMVQYKRLDGRAAIVCIDSGLEAIRDIIALDLAQVRLGRRITALPAPALELEETEVALTDEMHTYRATRYFPLNQDNHRRYNATDSIVERYRLVEQCIVGNILSFAKGIGVFFDGTVTAQLIAVSHTELYDFKDIKLRGFDLVFKTNVRLPSYIGLGKHASLGAGTIIQI